jgi:hypothetical protein
MIRNINVLYSSIYYELWYDVACRLNGSYGWNPVYIVSDTFYESNIRENFPSAVFHDRDKAVVGLPSDDCKEIIEPLPIDQNILMKYKNHESNVLYSFDRFDAYNRFSYRERMYYYQQMLKYWQGVLLYYKPDIVLFPTIPHMGYDYVIYMLCKEMNIKTPMFTEVPLGKLILIESITAPFPILGEYKKRLRCDNSISHSLEVEKYLSELQGNYNDAAPYFMRQYIKNESVLQLHNVIKIVKRATKKIWYDIYYNIHNRPQITDSKINNKPWNNIITKREERRYLSYAEQKRKKIKRYYYSKMQIYDKSQKYIYVPLHYQPEESSCPRGGHYTQQYLFIIILSKCIPSDWKIYVKEHPLQFKSMLKAIRSRDIYDYEHILSTQNAVFIDPSIPSFELIDNSQAIATLTGTAGWEAVNRGIPALIFGHPWYKGCEGVFYTPDYERCKNAINKINKGYKIDGEKVRLFAYVVDKIGFRATDIPEASTEYNISQEESIVNITNCLNKAYSKSK